MRQQYARHTVNALAYAVLHRVYVRRLDERVPMPKSVPFSTPQPSWAETLLSSRFLRLTEAIEALELKLGVATQGGDFKAILRHRSALARLRRERAEAELGLHAMAPREQDPPVIAGLYDVRVPQLGVEGVACAVIGARRFRLMHDSMLPHHQERVQALRDALDKRREEMGRDYPARLPYRLARTAFTYMPQPEARDAAALFGEIMQTQGPGWAA